MSSLTKSVFISHSCRDHLDCNHTIINKLIEAFTENNIQVYFDPLKAGDNISDKIEKEIKNSTHFLLIATEHSMNLIHDVPSFQPINDEWYRSRWVTVETIFAEYCANLGAVVFIPVRINKAPLLEAVKKFLYISYNSEQEFHPGDLIKRINEDSPCQRLPLNNDVSREFIDKARNLERLHATNPGQTVYLHDAVKKYDEAILNNLTNHHAWLNKGWCLWKLNDVGNAWRYVNIAQLLRPDSGRVSTVISRMRNGFKTLQ